MRRTFHAGFGLLLALATLPTPATASGLPATLTDASGRTVTVTDASRIIALGGTVTEILYALGLEAAVAGVDVTSTFPARAEGKPSVGYVRALSAEGVLALGPSLILATEDAGPKEAVAVLERASVPFLVVPRAHDAAGVGDTIRFIAEAVGEPEKGAALAAAVADDLAAVAAMHDRLPPRRKAVFVLGLSGGAPMVAGSGTGAADIFALAGIDNALSAMDGYKPASDEAVIAAAPEAIVLMAERNHALSDEAVLALPAFAATPAAADRRLVRESGTYLLNFGPRTAHAARDLAAAVYPEAGLPALPPRPWTTDADVARAGE